MLEENEVLSHPWIIGELALGNLGRKRRRLLSDLQQLSIVPALDDREVLDFVDARSLYGRGLGWVDVHLLGSAMVEHASFWSFDRKLADAASELGLEAL